MNMAMAHRRAGQDISRDSDPDTRAEPVSADRSAGPAGLRVETVSLPDLSRWRDGWVRLASRALSPNVFLDPDFVDAAGPVLGAGVRMNAVFARDGLTDRLVALFPVRPARWRLGGVMPILMGWSHAYAPLWLPLIDRDHGPGAIGAWLDHLAARRMESRIVLLQNVPFDDPVIQLLRTAVAAREAPLTVTARHERALLQPVRRDDWPETNVGGKKRKELGRLARRLADHGTVTFRTATAPADVVKAFSAHVALEYVGWKGRFGTSFLNLPMHRQFADRALRGLAARGQCRIDLLDLNGRAIATAITLTAGNRAWYWKTAYDETWRRYSPGVLLTAHLTGRMLADPAIAATDSCARPDHAMIDHLWRERMAVADLMFSATPRGMLMLDVATRLERVRSDLRERYAAFRTRRAPRP
jgi:CelD/BcsL family acetyltransferase involved in cellulose biosynthesis